MPFKQTRSLALKRTQDGKETISEALLMGSISDAELIKLNESTAFPSNAYGQVAPNEPRYNSQEAMQDFIEFMGPYLSDKMLFELSDRLCAIEVERGQQAFRNSTLAKVILRYEIERLDRPSQQPSYLLWHFKRHILPLIETYWPSDLEANTREFLRFNLTHALSKDFAWQENLFVLLSEFDVGNDKPELNDSPTRSREDLMSTLNLQKTGGTPQKNSFITEIGVPTLFAKTTAFFIHEKENELREKLNSYKGELSSLNKTLSEKKKALDEVSTTIESLDSFIESKRDSLHELAQSRIGDLVRQRQMKADLTFEIDALNDQITLRRNAYDRLRKMAGEIPRENRNHTFATLPSVTQLAIQNDHVIRIILAQLFKANDIDAITALECTAKYWQKNLNGCHDGAQELSRKNIILDEATNQIDNQLRVDQSRINQLYRQYSRNTAGELASLQRRNASLASIKASLPKIILEGKITHEESKLITTYKSTFSSLVLQEIELAFNFHLEVEGQHYVCSKFSRNANV